MTTLATEPQRSGTSGGVRRLLEVPDPVFHGLLGTVAALFALLIVAFLVTMLYQARTAFSHFGLGFLTGTSWDPVHAHYGALIFVVGTLETTFIAMLLAVPIGIGCALALAYGTPRRVSAPLSTAVEMGAAVPSVVFGLWGLLVLAPWTREYIEPFLAHLTGGHGPFNGPQIGVGLLLAGLILFVMVLPTMVAISRDVFLAVPNEQIEAAYAMGATRWQVLRRVVVPSSRSGLLGASTLAMGRALGETMAVTMVIGNTDRFAHSLFGTTQTMSSLIANEFTEATEPFHLASLMGIAVLLLLIAIIVNVLARVLVRSLGRQRAIGLGAT